MTWVAVGTAAAIGAGVGAAKKSSYVIKNKPLGCGSSFGAFVVIKQLRITTTLS